MWEKMTSFIGKLKSDDHSNDRRSISLIVAYVLLTLLWGASNRQQGTQLEKVTETNGTLFASVLVLATAQVATLACLLVPEGGREEGGIGSNSKALREPLAVAILSHAGLALMICVQSTSEPWLSWPAFCLPTMSILACWAVTSVAPRLQTVVASLAMCCGAVFACLIPSQVFSLSRTSMVAGLAGMSWLLRNMVIRQLVAGGGDNAGRLDIRFRSSLVLGTSFILSILLLIAVSLSLPTWLPCALCSLASCATGAGLVFVIAQLLRSHSVLTLTVVQIWVQMLETVLTGSQPRPEGLLWVLAVGLVCLGHYALLVKDRLDQGEHGPTFTPTHTSVGIHEQYTRMEFLLFSCGVLGLFALVFQPRVSQRDMDTLSYVGLDKVLRRLLATPEN